MRMKISMIILDEFVDFIKVIRIEMITLCAKCFSTDSAKSCALSALVLPGSLGEFVRLVQSWIIALTLWLKKVLNFALRLVRIGL